MTPPATAAAKSLPVAPATRRGQSGAPARRRAPVRHPRRVSGPARLPAAPAPGTVAIPYAPSPARRSAAGARRAREAPGLALRAIGAVNAASQSSLLDRLIRSRMWIGVLAFSLIGIVAMQVFVMKLNTEVGRTLAHEAALQRQITVARIEGSQESAGDLVEPAAAAAGMTVAAPGSVHFVSSIPSDMSAATLALSTPLPSLQSQAAATGAASPPEGQPQVEASAAEAPAALEGARG